MISSPGSAIASRALKKAMLPPAVTTTRFCSPMAMPFSSVSFVPSACDQRGDAFDRVVLVILRIGQHRANRIERLLRRPIVHHSLAQRDRARVLADELGHDRNDRRLHGLHAVGKVHRQRAGSRGALRGSQRSGGQPR